eukprot:scaffold11841_cov109-Isochrysis_galbana.AAC.2
MPWALSHRANRDGTLTVADPSRLPLCPPVSVSRTCRLFSPASLGPIVMVVLSTIAAPPTALCASTGSSTVFPPSSPRGNLMTPLLCLLSSLSPPPPLFAISSFTAGRCIASRKRACSHTPWGHPSAHFAVPRPGGPATALAFSSYLLPTSVRVCSRAPNPPSPAISCFLSPLTGCRRTPPSRAAWLMLRQGAGPDLWRGTGFCTLVPRDRFAAAPTTCRICGAGSSDQTPVFLSTDPITLPAG